RLDLAREHLMYLNPECQHPDLSNLFTTVDVTARVEPELPKIAPAVAAMRAMLDGPLPDVPVGKQCVDPDDCPFYDRCHPMLPPHHVSELYYAKKKAADLEAGGKTMIADLDESDAPNAPAKRQVRAVKAMQRVVEPGLAAKLAALKLPIVHLDFET